MVAMPDATLRRAALRLRHPEAGCGGRRGRRSSPGAASAWPTSRRRAGSCSARCPRPRPARSRSSSCASARSRVEARSYGEAVMEQIRVATFAGPGAAPVIHEVPRPPVPRNAALIQIGACGVCGTDLHILKGHWPKPLPWPFTLGHEIGGVIVEKGDQLTEDFMGKPLDGRLAGDDPAADALRPLPLLRPLSRERQQVPDAGLLRPLSRLRQGAAPVGRLGRACLCRPRHAARHQDLQAARRHAAAAGCAGRAAHLLHPRLQPRRPARAASAGATPW